jgi:hypothetical protein
MMAMLKKWHRPGDSTMARRGFVAQKTKATENQRPTVAAAPEQPCQNGFDSK